jgi:hypothetical protein
LKKRAGESAAADRLSGCRLFGWAKLGSYQQDIILDGCESD